MQPKAPFCQSCGMPMEKPDDFGTNTDGNRDNEYCHFCCQRGNFTDPNITLDQMIDNVVRRMVQMSETQIREMVQNLIPKLKRWQNRQTIEQTESKKIIDETKKIVHFRPTIGQIFSADDEKAKKLIKRASKKTLNGLIARIRFCKPKKELFKLAQARLDEIEKRQKEL